MWNGPEFVRLQATYRGRLGVEVGIFVAVDQLRRADRLSEDEEGLYFDIDDWFNANLPNPPFYEDGNPVGAVTWFRRSASAEILKRLEPLCDILTKYAVEWVAAESSDPGDVIYEDEFQVGVIPYARSDPSLAPQDLVLGPTTAGSKRHLGRRARQRLTPETLLTAPEAACGSPTSRRSVAPERPRLPRAREPGSHPAAHRGRV